MKILLTGASGFIGKHVVQEIQKKTYELFCISRSQGYDLLDYYTINQILKAIRADILIHLAWDVPYGGACWNNPNNVKFKEASISLFKRFLDYGGQKIIAAGTSAEYPASCVPVFEDMEVDKDNLTVYGRSKRECFEWLNNNTKDFSWLRIFFIYGQGENTNRLFPLICQTVKNNQKLSLKNPKSFFDYVWVKDIASLIERSIVEQSYQALNIGTGVSYSVAELYRIIEHYLKTGVFINYKEHLQPDINSRIPDCKKIKDLGVNFSLENGFSELGMRY